MQQIERYGVIALVFLLVTIVAVSFWGDSKSPGFWSRLTRRGARKDAVPEKTVDLNAPASATERAIEGELPLSPPAAGTPTLPAPVDASSLLASPGTPAPVPPASGIDPFAAPGQANASPGLASAPALIAPAPAPPSTGPEYVVQRGDSLGRIASRTLGSANRWKEIQDLNGGLDPKSLRIGMKLVLPASASLPKAAGADRVSTPARKATSAPHSPKTSGETYVVRAGDTLSSIAARMLGDGERWKEIVAANPGLDPRRLAVGKSIHLPAGQSSRVPSAREPALLAAASGSSSSSRPHVR